MSIECIYGVHVPTCDICNETLPGEQDYYEAVDAMKAAGWKNRMSDGEWLNLCCECQ